MKWLVATFVVLASLSGCQASGPDLCEASPCEHDGLCFPQDDGFVCVCPVGYAGVTCEVNADDCDPSPCFNGGTCADAVDGFTCTCQPGFSGVQCEIDVDDCSGSPCANEGLCIDRVEGYACACMPGFTGTTCEIDVDDCESDPCFNGGACTDGVDDFACACLPGFWGGQCEAAVDALAVITPSLRTAVVGAPYALPMMRTGGTSGAVWSIAPGGTNAAWLSIDPATGLLEGTPTAAELGPVSVTVHVEETLYPANSDEETLAFSVIESPAAYETSFEGACPDGWTLTGDWQCGVPTNVGAATASTGTQCLGTQLAGNYRDLQSWAGTTATSPDIALVAGLTQRLDFRAWIDTEGSTYDGFHVEISTDGGTSFTTLTSVTPAYPLTIAGRPGWGGHQSALGWQVFGSDLSAFAGQTVQIRFAFQSDSSGTFPGVYVDDVYIGH